MSSSTTWTGNVARPPNRQALSSTSEDNLLAGLFVADDFLSAAGPSAIGPISRAAPRAAQQQERVLGIVLAGAAALRHVDGLFPGVRR